MKKENDTQFPEKPIVIYTTPDGAVKVDVLYEDEMLWLTQKALAELFQTTKQNISLHLKHIINEGEIDPKSTVKESLTVQKEGGRKVTRKTLWYNLDVVIAVGYRVNSVQATQFRIWATKTLKEFIQKGFVLNDEMLKNGRSFGKDYFDELLERIREIRASERRSYQKIADLFEQCSSDYSPTAELTRTFYAFIQNKLHFAVAGNTAAEIIFKRADAQKPTMGLTTWKGAPDKKILRSDTHVAKNYLNKAEMDKLNRLVVMFIDFAEIRALNHQVMTMKEWVEQVDKFLGYTDQQILQAAGIISHEKAIAKANEEYDKFRIRQDREYISEFDKAFEKYLRGE